MFDEWCPDVEGIMDDLKQEIGKLSTMKVIGRLSKHWVWVTIDTSTSAPSVFASMPTSQSAFIPNPNNDNSIELKAVVRSPTGLLADRPFGHHVESWT